VIVIGLGAMGSAACHQLAARGAGVIGIDRYSPPHVYGSTHGDTRMTRLAVGEGAEYVPLVRRSHQLWREMEALTGVSLLTQPGGLVLGAAANPFLSQTRALARQHGIAHENLSSAAVAERFPMFTIDEGTEGYLEPGSGYVRPERAVRAQLSLARRHGASIRLGERVEEWTTSAAGVRVSTATQVYEADQLVICAGSWISRLFPEGGRIFSVYRQLLFWFPIRAGYERLRDMPVFVWEFGGDRAGVEHLLGFYGFPAIDGRHGGVKVATEVYDETTMPDGRQHPATPGESEAMYRRYIAPHLPWLGPGPLRTVSCLYTSTHASRFVIDRHPDHDAVLIVSPCSGHGFKHSPAIGEAIAQWVIDGASEIDLAPFALSRAVRPPSRRRPADDRRR
jgi:sarcosine oxidase